VGEVVLQFFANGRIILKTSTANWLPFAIANLIFCYLLPDGKSHRVRTIKIRLKTFTYWKVLFDAVSYNIAILFRMKCIFRISAAEYASFRNNFNQFLTNLVAIFQQEPPPNST